MDKRHFTALVVLLLVAVALILSACNDEANANCPGPDQIGTVADMESRPGFKGVTYNYVKLVRDDGTVCIRQVSGEGARLYSTGDKIRGQVTK